MQIGVMNNPFKKLLPQIHWIGENGFDYIDLAVEPPLTLNREMDCQAIRKAADLYNLDIVIHTSPHLPLADRHLKKRQAAWTELLNTIKFAQDLGSPLVAVHYLGAPAFYSFHKNVAMYVDLLQYLIHAVGRTKVSVALENSPSNKMETKVFREIFNQIPEIRLLLDVAHAHLNNDIDVADDFLNDMVLGQRLSHIHISDNNGMDDLHLPLESVRNGINWKKMIRMIRNHPYDGRITLEVFSPDQKYLLISRNKLMKWWDEAG